jgi:ABC-type transporter Mla MlaB component
VSNVSYESSVLKCHDPSDDECDTCRFLSGDLTTSTLLKVIENLDRMLSQEEKAVRELSSTLSDVLQRN